MLVTIPAAILAFSSGSWGPIVLVGLWGFGYGAVPVALQTWIGRAAPAEFEAGTSLYIASFQGSIAAGSLLGGVAVALGNTAIALAAGAVLALTAVTVFILGTRRGTERTPHNVSVPGPEVPAAVMKENPSCP
jgi:predicted MFS family arabinose efflux permease